MANIPVEFVFYDWQRGYQSIYNTEECLDYTDGDLHSGTVLSGSINLDEDDAERLKEAMSRRASPMLVIKVK